MVSILPRKQGFGQRHHTDPKPSRYLTDIIDPLYYEGLSRSPVNLKLIREDIFKFRNNLKRPTDPLLDMAIAQAYHVFKLPNRVQMLHLNDVFRTELNIWSSSPGLPWTTLGYRTKGELRHHRAITSVRWFWHRIKLGHKIMAPDSCAFVRSHVVETGEAKVRAVWGYPATITFGEAVFAYPLIQAFKKNRTPIAYGYDTAKGGAKKIFSEISGYQFGVALDFKSFDKTVPKWLIEIAFEILSTNIDFVHYNDYGVANAANQYRMFAYIKDYFINTPIRMCDGSRYRKHSGVASGSYFTQLIDSIVNYILINWAFLEQHGHQPEFIRVFGDDSICGSRNWIDFDLIIDQFAKVGMILNLKKSLVTRNKQYLTFLGFTINTGYPTKETKDWFASLMFPERPDQSWDDVATRALGLLHASAGLDYQFDLACRNILAFRPYELNWSRPMQKMLAVMGLDFRELTCTVPSHLQLALRVGYI
nr:MAG: putative RNA dependent RNA polymerase [Ilomantsi partiti-like virus 1]